MDSKNINEAFKQLNKIGSVGRGPRGTHERAVLLLDEVAAGSSKAKQKDKKTGEMKEVVRKLGPAQVADRVIRAMRFGATVEEVKEKCPDLPKRYPWAQGREALVALAKERDVSLTDMSQVFGLEEEGTKVVASEPEEEEEDTKKGRNAKASNAAHKARGRSAQA